MNKQTILSGTIHKIPVEFKKILVSEKLVTHWNGLTPLARNEWICWITSGVKVETRNIRIKKAISKIKNGMRRPCCWTGCAHR